jgi:hypothetical protein
MTGLRRFGPLLAVGLLLAAAGIAASMATPQIRPVPFHPPTPPPPIPSFNFRTPSAAPQQAEPTGTTAEPETLKLPGWLIVTTQVLVVLIVVALAGLLVWYLLRNGLRLRERRRDADRVPAPAGKDQVIAAVDAGLSDLDDMDTDPRRAVIACWVRLEQAAAAAGTPRQVGDTPAELVTRLLSGHDVSAPVLYRLAEVYRLARYAAHTVDTTMRDQARAALGQLRAELSQEREPVVS